MVSMNPNALRITRAVPRHVIEARVRRALARDGAVLRKTRPGNTWAKIDLGDYFTVDSHTGFPDRRHLDLDELARELFVLKPFEVIAD